MMKAHDENPNIDMGIKATLAARQALPYFTMNNYGSVPMLAPALITPSQSPASSVAGSAVFGSEYDQQGDVSKTGGQHCEISPACSHMDLPNAMVPNATTGHVPLAAAAPVAPAAPVGMMPYVLPSQPLTSGISNIPHHPITEFLYQLTKMLTDNNRDTIEWCAGKIKVHDPKRLADEVLHKYFRHNKFASFQRQLNYFGFRKIAGKGRMSPCSYVNDAATEDISSLLYIKRKTNTKRGAKDSDSKDASKKRKPEEQIEKSQGEDDNGAKRRAIDEINKSIMGGSALLSMPSMVARNATPIVADYSSSNASAPRAAPSYNDYNHYSSNKHALAVAAVASGLSVPQFQSAIGDTIDPKAAATANQYQYQLSLDSAQSSSMPCPATAAMNAVALGQSSNQFDYADSLNLLASGVADNSNATLNAASGNSHLLSSFPSSKSIYPRDLSSASLNQLAVSNLGSGMGNCYPSLLEMNSILSRESSLVDLAMLPTYSTNAATFQYPSGGVGGVVFEPTPIQEMNLPKRY
mmetsp:Transcript_22701/g.33803  ORF Transcript_22701/g.33803 Transcript_22701/m.33803 type:complete len:523 (-) Transcript_22701:560-2128(-)